MRPPTKPQCPYCGNIADDNESWNEWFDKHGTRRHCWWWKIRKIFRKGYNGT